MDWKIEERPEAIVVELTSNPVNKQNLEYIRDAHAAMDRVDKLSPHKPLILTARGKIFSAGLDFDYVFPLFARGQLTEVEAWFDGYRESMLRVLTSPRLTIAALNGHAIAGGMVLALCCDFRLVAEGDAKLGLNEVVIGIPMPAVYNELARFRLGELAAAEAVLLGKLYGVADAKRLGLVHDVVPQDKLLDAALRLAKGIPPDTWSAYAQTKRSLQYPVLGAIRSWAQMLDRETYRILISPESVRAQTAKYEALKAKR